MNIIDEIVRRARDGETDFFAGLRTELLEEM
jgi:hypothetical protein